LIDLLAVENIDRKAILVRIAQREFSGRGPRNQTVNAPPLVFGCLREDALPERRERSTNLKRGIEPQRQSVKAK